MQHSPLSVFRARARRAFRKFTWGGEWAISLPAQVKRNLSWFFFDGLFASASDNIIVTYLTLYFLALGATRGQIGLMSSFSSLAAALFLLPGAFLVERLGHRKEITVVFGGGVARLVILMLALLPLFFGESALVWAAIVLSVARNAFANLAFPAWVSITGDIVPMEGRGRFFGSRNFVMGIAGMLMILLAGELITRTAQPSGYQLAFGLAFLLGAFSTYSFGRLKDPHSRASSAGVSISLRNIFGSLKTNPTFVALCLVMALWSFSLNIAGPFFSVYMVENLKFTAAMVGVTSIVTSIASLLVQRRVGELADRWGPRKVQAIAMLLIPLLPLAWVFITRLWNVVLLNSFGGVVWGAFNLASFNFLLTLTPEAQRARYSAVYQVLITLALAGGAALGAWVVTEWGYRAVFLFSAVGRITAGLLFLRFVSAAASPGNNKIPAKA